MASNSDKSVILLIAGESDTLVIDGESDTDNRQGADEEETIEAQAVFGRTKVVQSPGELSKVFQFNESSSRYEIKRNTCINLVLPQCVREETTEMSLTLDFHDDNIKATEEMVSCNQHRLKNGVAGG